MANESMFERIQRIKEQIKAQKAAGTRFPGQQHGISAKQHSGFAEKVVIGWENPMSALRYSILVKEVPSLNGYYHKTETDSEGFTVGCHLERIFTTEEQYRKDREEHEANGFTVESHPELRRYVL